MKKLLQAASLVLSGLLIYTGCNRKPEGGADSAGTKHAIADIPKGTTHIYWQSVHAGAQKAGEELGYQIYWNGPERETDRERQIQIIEDFIVQKVDGIVLAPLDRKALIPSVTKLAGLKIPCATTDRENGFMETIQKEFTGIQIVDSKYGQDTVETALQATEDLLTKQPDLQGIYACNASTAVGALQGLQSQKRAEVKMVGFDAEKALLDGLKAGQIDSLVVQNPFRMGYEGVKAVVASIKGENVPRRIDTGVELIT